MKKKLRTQFIINEPDKIKRGHFYDYLINNYNFNISFPFTRENFININFPMVVDFKEKNFWVCNSITCNACAAQQGVMITLDEYFIQEKELLKIKKYKKLLK